MTPEELLKTVCEAQSVAEGGPICWRIDEQFRRTPEPCVICEKIMEGLSQAIKEAQEQARKEEREACAEVAENWKSPLRPGTEARLLGHNEAAREIGKKVRSRGTQSE